MVGHMRPVVDDTVLLVDVTRTGLVRVALNELVLFARAIVVVDDGSGRVVLLVNCALANDDNKTQRAMLGNAIIRGVSDPNVILTMKN